MQRYTHAIVARIPNRLRFDGKTKIAPPVDLAKAHKEQEDLCEALREAGVDVIELPPEEDALLSSLFVDDAAIVINGTALLTRPKLHASRTAELMALLQELSWQVYQTPADDDQKKPVVLEGSDVLFTGREIFVGLRKGSGTNVAGATVLARTFPDLATVPVALDGDRPLKHYIALAAPEVLVVGHSKQAQTILKRIEREATYRYKVLTLNQDDAVNCLSVNGNLVFRNDWVDSSQKFASVAESSGLLGVQTGEMVAMGGLLSQYCLLVRKLKTLKNLF